jgi:hypothetical protein
MVGIEPMTFGILAQWVVPEKIHTPHGGNRKFSPPPPGILEWFILPPSPDVKAQNFFKGYNAEKN